MKTRDEWHVYAKNEYVLPVHARANTCLFMTGCFPREMVHYTIKHNDILRSKDGLIGVSEEAYPLLTPQGQRSR